MMEEFALVIDPKTQTWSGELPHGCRQVYLEFLFPDGTWKRANRDFPRPRKETVEQLEEIVRKQNTLCKYPAYRLVSADNSQEDSMAKSAKTPKTPKTPKPVKEKKEPVAGVFRAGSINANIYTVLSDGKPRELKELAKLCGAGSLSNFEKGKIPKIKKHGNDTGTFDIVKDDAGKYKMVFGAAAKKAAPAPKAPKSEEPVPEPKATVSKKKAAAKPAAKAPKSEGEKPAGVSIS